MARRVVSKITADGRFENIEESTDAQREAFNAMLASGEPPAVHGTDSHIFRGKYNGNPFPGMIGPMQKEYMQQAAAAGVSLSGKVYNTSLVRPEFQGRFDPQALVGSVSDIKAVARMHPEWDVEGVVNQSGRQPDVLDDSPYRVSDQGVEDEVIDELIDSNVDAIGVKEFNDLKDKKRRQLEGAMNE
jgi:hypothetical protein